MDERSAGAVTRRRQPGRVPLPLVIRLLAKLDAGAGAGGCWLWTGYANPQTGYGQMTLNKAEREVFRNPTATAPVVSCTIFHGPRPAGMEVLHSCDVRACANPNHLRWGTPLENSQDAWARGRQKRGEDNACARHTDVEVRQAIARVRSGETAVAVGRDIGISHSIVSRWVKGLGRARYLKEEVTL